MGDVLRNWIQARLGILIDLRPEVFGHYTSDGSLLAQILHSYDIISRDQLETIAVTQDPALCRVNLKHLRFWLRFVGIDCDDESIEEISCGKGSTSLRLFYKLYLCLETKDRLHFITLQKEREKFVPASKKFDVTRVCEDPLPYQPPEHPLSKKLAKGQEVLDWHGSKFPLLLRRVRREREKLEVSKPITVVQPVVRCVPEAPRTSLDSRKEESAELDRFALKHRVRPKSTKPQDAKDKKRKSGDGDDDDDEEEEEEDAETTERKEKGETERSTSDRETGRTYVERLKDRTKREKTAAAVKTKMQNALLSKLWEKMAEKQERRFDEAIAKRVLDQSMYEKRIVTKLCEVREQKNIMAENQKVVEDITAEATEVEHRASYERAQDLVTKREKDIEIECERMCELRHRLLTEKIRKIREKHWTFCRDVVEDLASIALNVGDHRRVNNGRVPVTLLSEWKTLFLKSQPIFDEEIPYEAKHRHSGSEELELLLKSDVWAKFDKVDIALLDDYLEIDPPWNASLPMPGEEALELTRLGRMVLGYAVHRLLDGLYSHSLGRSQALLSKFKRVAILLGIGNPTVYESMTTLLDRVGFRVVRMEDAINYCLERYKREMSDFEYIDTSIVAATADVVRKLRSDPKETSCRRLSRVDKRSRWADETSSSLPDTATRKSGKIKERRSIASTKTPEVKEEQDGKEMKEMKEESKKREKETQTSRNVPYDDMDPVLTDSAYIGKWTYEFLALGEPITDNLATKILIEYLKSLEHAKGWVLIDYPSTYEQMSRLETAMTGLAPPPESKSIDFEDISIEDIETVTPRIVFEDKSDVYALKRQSRLVPDPIVKRPADATSPTFATIFVRVKQQPKRFERGDGTYEALDKDASSIDRFYASRKIARILYYSSFDLLTLKILARLAIGDPLQRKPSKELFGEALNLFERDAKRGATLKAAVVRRLVTEEEFAELESLRAAVDADADAGDAEDAEDAEDEATGEISSDDYRIELDSGPPKPGEPNWNWIDFPLPAVLLENLARLWEGLEKLYVEELKELLFIKSIHASSIVPYTDFLKRNAREFVKRPDNKQDLLHRFHRAFNAIDEDARNDVDVKCELHRRVADFQMELWQICDERRRTAEEERKRYVNDHWTTYEAVILFDIYVGIIQAELDRCVDTICMLQDYYLGMTKKPLREIGVSKVILNKITPDRTIDADDDVRDGEEEDEDEDEDETKIGERVPNRDDKTTDRKKGDRARSTKADSTSVSVSPPAAIDRALLQKEINDAFTDRSKVIENIRDVYLFKGVMENVDYAKNLVEALFAASVEQIEREQMAISKGKDLATDSNESIVAKLASRGQDLVLEWRYAITYEIERIRLKLESIANVARLDIAFLLETLQGAFHGIYDSIVDRLISYWQEMKSVNEMANVFCLAIEEGRRLENEILLDGDRFVIRSNVYVVTRETGEPTRHKETPSPLRFRISNLVHLMEIFKRVAPYGTMAERTFVYILQDLTSHGQDEGEPMLLPCSWYQLKSTDIAKLVKRLYGSTDYVDWREFLVHAMDLPTPSYRQILIARDRFRIQDPELNEVVTLSRYRRTSLWFLECIENCDNARRLLLDEFQRDREELYDEEHYRVDTEITASVPENRPSTAFNATPCCTSTQEILRRILAKELLCRMFMVDRYSVNYTALLLAFCKDENPRDGFGKALALAIGNRVCTDAEEGERYVEELLERKKLARPSFQTLDREALEVTSMVVDRLMHRVARKIDRRGDRETKDARAFKSFDQPMASESVAKVESLSGCEIQDEQPSMECTAERYATDPETVVYWISRDICLTVLAAALSWDTFSEGRGCETLVESLSSVYRELWDPNLNAEQDVVLAHRLLNHDFVTRLLNRVSKFTVKNLDGIVVEILRAREKEQDLADTFP
ncbi:PREDICTED: sperm flagellar protein 2-like [Eufriesea mexicana]|nr:PREDICTED: sperm flagellar protein 2-like [Eufriesea mexicana]